MDFKAYINPPPKGMKRFGVEWQREGAPAGDEYLEDKTGKVFDERLLKAVRKDRVIGVRRLFLLAPWRGGPATRRRKLAERVDAIKAKGGVVLEWETGRRTDDKGGCSQMLMGGYEDIATSGRANQGRKRGNPIELEPEQRQKALLVWRSREHKNDPQRLAAIEKAIGRRLGHTWCWVNFGPPSGRKQNA